MQSEGSDCLGSLLVVKISLISEILQTDYCQILFYYYPKLWRLLDLMILQNEARRYTGQSTEMFQIVWVGRQPLVCKN